MEHWGSWMHSGWMSVFWLLLFAVVVVAVIVALRPYRRGTVDEPPEEAILRRRLARGEIDEEEFLRLHDRLRR